MPTVRQKRAFKEVLNGSTITSAMVKAGYSATTASTTGKLTNTKGWEELMEKELPDGMLAKKHREGLNATTKKPHLVDRDDKGRPVYEYESETDFDARYKYLDSAYKLKGKYAKENQGNTINIFSIVLNAIEKEDESIGRTEL